MVMDREEQGVERRTPYDCAGCDGFPTAGNDPCEVCGASSSHATPDAVNADKAVAPITADELGEIMQEEWGEICEDTQCHPLDMERQGRKLFYNPRHWTEAIARRLSERTTPTPDKALMPEAAVGEGITQADRDFADMLAKEGPRILRGIYRDELSNLLSLHRAPTPTPVEEPGELVEIVAKAIYDATHASLPNCYDWNDLWEDHQEAGRDRYYKEARAAIAALAATNAGQVEGKLGYDDAWVAYEPAAGKEVFEKMSWPQVCAVRHAFIAGFSAALKANGDAS